MSNGRQDDFSAPREFLADKMRDVFLATAAELARRLGGTGYFVPTPAQFVLLSHVPPNGIRIVDLARKSGVTKQAIHQMANQLIAAGVLERLPDGRDGRSKLLRPTPYALQGYALSRRILTDIHSEWQQHLGKETYLALEDRATALRALMRGSG